MYAVISYMHMGDAKSPNVDMLANEQNDMVGSATKCCRALWVQEKYAGL